MPADTLMGSNLEEDFQEAMLGLDGSERVIPHVENVRGS